MNAQQPFYLLDGVGEDGGLPGCPFLPVLPGSFQNSPEGALGHMALLHDLPEGDPCLPQLHSHPLFMFGKLFARFGHNQIHVFVPRAKSVGTKRKSAMQRKLYRKPTERVRTGSS